MGRRYQSSSIVCVCNSTFCDTFEPIKVTGNEIHVIESNKLGLRFWYSIIYPGTETKPKFKEIEITFNKNEVFQEIKGFGACFTDAAAFSSMSLGLETARDIIKQFYSPSGLAYSLGRLTIGGTDFSTRKYTYNDLEPKDGEVAEDFDLKNFALQEEDTKYKIPFVKTALEASSGKLSLFASAWSAPAWMKTNNDLAGRGQLKGNPGDKYHKTWAKYLVKFLQEYEKQGIKVWGLTTGNEPINGLIPRFPFNCMAFTAQTQRDFVKMDLGPALKEAGYFIPGNRSNSIQVIVMDDQRWLIPYWSKTILSDKEAAEYVSGVAFHWYGNQFGPAFLLDGVHKSFPDVFLIASEATVIGKPTLGSWENAEKYATDILTDLLHWTTAWIDWNWSLNLEGGPSWVPNSADAPIIVNASSGEYYKQPTYYALGHFSKFIHPGSKRIGVNIKGDRRIWPKVQTGSFKTPSGKIVTVVINGYDDPRTVKVTDSVTGISFRYDVSSRSITTFVSAQ